MKPKIILWHADSLGTHRAFDLFVRKGTELDEEEKEFVDSLYDANCEVVHKFLEKFPDYKFLGSEDLLHIEEINTLMLKNLNLLYRKGWERVDWKEDRKAEGRFQPLNIQHVDRVYRLLCSCGEMVISDIPDRVLQKAQQNGWMWDAEDGVPICPVCLEYEKKQSRK